MRIQKMGISIFIALIVCAFLSTNVTASVVHNPTTGTIAASGADKVGAYGADGHYVVSSETFQWTLTLPKSDNGCEYYVEVTDGGSLVGTPYKLDGHSATKTITTHPAPVTLSQTLVATTYKEYTTKTWIVDVPGHWEGEGRHKHWVPTTGHWESADHKDVIGNPSQATQGISIPADLAVVSLAATSFTVLEGQTAHVPVTINRNMPGPVTVTYTLNGVGATLTIPAGQTTSYINVTPAVIENGGLDTIPVYTQTVKLTGVSVNGVMGVPTVATVYVHHGFICITVPNFYPVSGVSYLYENGVLKSVVTGPLGNAKVNPYTG